MKTTLEKKLRSRLSTLGVPAESCVVAGVSGGADSVALADALSRVHAGALVIAHLNHLIRGMEADEDQDFVEKFARLMRDRRGESRPVTLFAERQDIPALAADTGRNVEAVARERRYDFLERAALQNGSEFVVTAHTLDDQIETLCMRLIRGTGPEGLRGIHVARPLSPRVSLLRPLLEVSRAEVLAHCDTRQIEFRSDSSNNSLLLFRNRVRHELLPHLRSFNPRFDEALLRLGSLVAEDDGLIAEMAVQILERMGQVDADESSLGLDELTREHPALQRRILRLWLRKSRGDLRRIDRVHLEALEGLISRSEGGRYVELPDGFRVTKRGRRLVLEKTNLEEKVTGLSAEQNGGPFREK